MSRNPSKYRFGGRDFGTLAALREHISPIITVAPLKKIIVDGVLQDLINERHFWVTRLGLHAAHFRKEPCAPTDWNPFSWRMSGYFEPIRKWIPVSYNKCLRPWSFRHDFDEACRHRFKPISANHRRYGACCFDCSGRLNLHLDYISPQFADVAEELYGMLTPGEVESWMGFDWVNQPEGFLLPEGHPVTRRFDEIHASASYQVLCDVCHRKQTSARKKAT